MFESFTSRFVKAAPIVAVVDDDELLQHLVVDLLKMSHCDPRQFLTCEDALKWLSLGREKPSFILADLRFPSGMQGQEFVPLVRQHTDAGVAVVTGAMLSPQEETLFNRLGVYVINKPIQPSKIIELVLPLIPTRKANHVRAEFQRVERIDLGELEEARSAAVRNSKGIPCVAAGV